MADQLEIERKFLVDHLPPDLDRWPSARMRQGYLAVSDHVEVRVRAVGDRCTQTIKDLGDLARREVEVTLSQGQFEALWPATDGCRVDKTRYQIRVGDHRAELDVFHGALDGLLTVEVEFGSVAASRSFDPPSWFGRDVTSDPRYKNRNLAVVGLPE